MTEEFKKNVSLGSYLSLVSNKIREIPSQNTSKKLVAFVECTEELHKKLINFFNKGEIDKFVAVNNDLYYLSGFQSVCCCISEVEIGDAIGLLIEKVACEWGWQEPGSNDPSGPFDNYSEMIEHAVLILGKGHVIEVGKVRTADPGKYLSDAYPLNNIEVIVDIMESCAFDDKFDWVDDDLFEYDKEKSEVIMNELRNDMAKWARRYFSSKYWVLEDLKVVKI